MVTEISAETLRDMLDAAEAFELVDTRPDESFEGWHVPGAIQYVYRPGETFDPEDFVEATGVERGDRVVTMCAKGVSSHALADRLEEAGFEDVSVVEGGMEAWSAVYDRVEIPTTADELEIVQIQRRAKGCLGYLVGSDGEAIVVDPTRHTDEFVDAAERRGYEITHVFDTHVHADHISGGRELADAVGAPYHLSARASDRGVAYEYTHLERNQVVRIGDVDVKAVAAPGHTTEMLNFLVGTEAILTGDTLFVDSVGRTELQFSAEDGQTGDPREGADLLYESLHRTLLAEPDSLAVLPGHFPTASETVTPGEPIASSIEYARTELPLLQQDRESFVETLTDRLPEKPPNYETVIGINRGRESPADEQEAIELELGPNRCAATGD